MKRSPAYAVLSLATAAVLAAPPAAAQQPEGQASGEAIQVHGNWTIEVYDGDRLVERREFQNDLAATGARTLVRLIMSETSIIHRGIRVAQGLCIDDAGGASNVYIYSASYDTTGTGPCTLNTLNESSSTDGGTLENNSITLEGAFTADVDGSVDGVQTILRRESDFGTVREALTIRTLTPIDVTAGQEVRVTVVITFG